MKKDFVNVASVNIVTSMIQASMTTMIMVVIDVTVQVALSVRNNNESNT